MTTKTTCPYCGVGCGVIVSQAEGGGFQVQGDPDHPANLGRLCSKGSALAETIRPEGRLLHPEVDGKRVSWDSALDAVASAFRESIARHGPDSVALYVSGQLLTEDYYVANKLVKGFLGTGNIDTNSRLCMSSAVAGHKRAFGSDTVPGCYEDLEQAKLLVITGSNLAWCHPVLFQRIRAARERNPWMRVVVIDPRRTSTCDIADLHLPLRPGSDALLFAGLLTWLEGQGLRDSRFVADHTNGIDAALAAARAAAPSLAGLIAGCELTQEQIETFYGWFATTAETVTLFSQGTNQSSSGTDKANAIINCHLLTGRIGRPGMGPFSITGQPNAMGGREVGGLANQLAAHMEIDNPEHRALVGEFWNSPRLPEKAGLKAVDLFQAVEAGRVKVAWIVATNPLVSLPDADRVRRALEKCERVIVSDCVADTDTLRLAQIRLPALTWGERDGTVTNSERRISRQRPFLPPPGEARADWWIFSQVARRLGFGEQFDYGNSAAIFREHAALSAFRNNGSRDFDLGGLAGLDDAGYDALVPVQWPVAPNGTQRMFGEGRFYTPDRRARFLPIVPLPPATPTSAKYPFVLNTGRVRDQWHTMTRTGLSPRLGSHDPEPFVEVHPEDAAAAGLQAGGLAQVESPLGSIRVRVRVHPGQRRGSLFVPIHWNATNSAAARVGTLIPPVTDPFSGQPEAKHAPARIAPWRPAWHGFLLSREPAALPTAEYWSRARGEELYRYELAGETPPESWDEQGVAGYAGPGERTEFYDAAAGRYRCAWIHENRLMACLFVGPDHRLPARDWLIELFARPALDQTDRTALLTGAPPAGAKTQGRTVCACFGVGVETIRTSIRTKGLKTVEEIGRTLKAGTNCGSCVPELRALLKE